MFQPQPPRRGGQMGYAGPFRRLPSSSLLFRCSLRPPHSALRTCYASPFALSIAPSTRAKHSWRPRISIVSKRGVETRRQVTATRRVM